MVYTMYIHGILKFKFLVFFCILLLQTYVIGEDNVMKQSENSKKAYYSFKSRQCKFMVYTWHILGIYIRYPVHILCLVIFKFRQLSKEQWMLEEVGMHICSMAFQGTNAFVPKSHVLLQDRIYQVYTWIYQVYTRHIPCESQVRAFLVAHPRLEASDRDFLRIFSVLATERPPTRGWGRPKFHNQVLIS